MRKFLAVLALLLVPIIAWGQISQPGPNSAQRLGGVWTFAAITMDGSSDTLSAGGTGYCKSLIVFNPAANSNLYVDLSGGTASATTRGVLIAPGTWMSFTGAMAPCSLVTAIGTNTNVIQTWTSP